MSHLEHLRNRIRQHLFIWIFLENVLLGVLWWIGTTFTTLNSLILLGVSLVLSLGLSLIIVFTSASYIMQPMQALWQAILHLNPTEQGIAAPRLEDLKLGRELVTSLAAQIYQLADTAEHAAEESQQQAADVSHNFIAQNLPLPLFVLDAEATIKFANEAAADYIGIATKDLIGKNVYMVLDMSFPSEDTFDKWLKDVKINSATATKSWERVRLAVRDNHPTLLFDLAAYYNRDNAQKMETMFVLFDHTKQYSQDDQAISFIALSVHELRTPLTMLRGYIEVLDDELNGTLTPELQDFILKMRTISEQLTAFVNNILNVARVDNDQLEVQLQEENWLTILNSSVDMLKLRARVRGIELQCTVAPDLPTVGVDRLSINEVVTNLVDNAIKYSANGKVIRIDAHMTQDGLVETTVQDFGLGISSSVMPNLFTKFYRDHRNRAQIGGTGLGLYLSKAIITAHGGSMWVKSKEGEGSTFGFTILPYTQLTEELKRSGNNEITRGAHGWIKNHSLYRR